LLPTSAHNVVFLLLHNAVQHPEYASTELPLVIHIAGARHTLTETDSDEVREASNIGNASFHVVCGSITGYSCVHLSPPAQQCWSLIAAVAFYITIAPCTTVALHTIIVTVVATVQSACLDDLHDSVDTSIHMLPAWTTIHTFQGRPMRPHGIDHVGKHAQLPREARELLDTEGLSGIALLCALKVNHVHRCPGFACSVLVVLIVMS
jgi:hypothetical protein